MPISNEKVRFDEQSVSRIIDQALDEVRSCADVASLHAYRQLFRRRVPLHLRAYVAARLLEVLASSGRGEARKGQRGDATGKSGHGKPDERIARGQAAPLGNGTGSKPKNDKAPRAGRKGDERRAEGQTRAGETPEEVVQPKTRQRRYRGEGVVLFVNAGRRQRFYARVAIAMLNDAPGVGEDFVGDVRTMDNYSFIEVAPEAEAAAIAALDGADFRGRSLVANRARKRGESAPDNTVGATVDPALDEPESGNGWVDSEDLSQDDEGQPGVDAESPSETEY